MKYQTCDIICDISIRVPMLVSPITVVVYHHQAVGAI